MTATSLIRDMKGEDVAPVPTRPGKLMIFAAELLPVSHTFVRDHVENVRALNTVLVGINRVGGLELDHLETATLPSAKLARLALWLFGYSPFLDRLVRERGVVAIHAHFADGGMRISRYAKRRKLPLIVTLHGADVLRVRPKISVHGVLKNLLHPGMLKSAAVFLAVSDYIRTAALKAGYPADRLRKHILGIPIPSINRHKPAASAEEPPNILFVGRFVEKKGLSYLLRACRLLAEQGCRFTLTVVGDGPLRGQHGAEAEPLGALVRFAGLLSPAQVREELGAADIFCMPSTEAADGDNEGLPIVCLEAQAAGLPVVAFAQGPVLEGVVHGRTGILVPDKSVEDLGAALKSLINDPEQRVTLGAAGTRFIRDQFDIRDRSRELDELYEAIVDRGVPNDG
jgi:glycosyltransferase involved in cell wall biosynthesis